MFINELCNTLNVFPYDCFPSLDATYGQAHKDELNRINKYVVELQEKVKKECDNFSEDVKYWAEYKTGE